jgi:hypothetical protein
MGNKEDIIAKIMKLLELSNEEKNDNPNERENASRMAAKMMADYAIDIADLRSSQPKEDTFVTIDVDGSSEVKVDYEASLANAIANAFDCKVISSYRNGPWQILFCGTKHDLEISVFFFKHLRRTLSGMARLNFPKDTHHARKNYAFGMVSIIRDRLNDLYKKREEFIPSDCTALVVVKKQGLTKYFDQQFPDRKNSRRTSIRGNTNAYYQGQADGKTINLSRPITHTGGERAAIG